MSEIYKSKIEKKIKLPSLVPGDNTIVVTFMDGDFTLKRVKGRNC